MPDFVRVTRQSDGLVVAERAGVAVSFGEKLLGLMFRAGLSPGEGLWLRRTAAIHMMFMRFPIDAVFTDVRGRVVAVFPSLPPWTGSARAPALNCLELPAGGAAGLKAGDVLVFAPLE